MLCITSTMQLLVHSSSLILSFNIGHLEFLSLKQTSDDDGDGGDGGFGCGRTGGGNDGGNDSSWGHPLAPMWRSENNFVDMFLPLHLNVNFKD